MSGHVVHKYASRQRVCLDTVFSLFPQLFTIVFIHVISTNVHHKWKPKPLLSLFISYLTRKQMTSHKSRQSKFRVSRNISILKHSFYSLFAFPENLAFEGNEVPTIWCDMSLTRVSCELRKEKLRQTKRNKSGYLNNRKENSAII